MRKLALLATVSGMLALAGCSSTLVGRDQVLMIQTSDNVDAHCVLENGESAWTTDHTPAYVSISRSHTDMRVSCKAINGEHGSVHAGSSLDPKAVTVTVVSGAAIAATPFLLASGQPIVMGVGMNSFGAKVLSIGSGAASVGEDSYNGTLFHYDAQITVPMMAPPPGPKFSDAYLPMEGVTEPVVRRRYHRPVAHHPVAHHHVAPICTCAKTVFKPSGS